MKSLIVAFIMCFSVIANADYLTCDPQPSEVVTKYQIKLNGEVVTAGIEQVIDGQVQLYYNIDHLPNGKHVVSAQAGNDEEEWSPWSETLEFYRGVPTPQNIGLYCVTEDPQRLSRDGFSVYHVSAQNGNNEQGENAIDGSIDSFWHTGWVDSESQVDHPHEIQLDLGRVYTVSGFWYQSRQSTNLNCMILDYKFYVSENGTDWAEVASGKLPDSQNEHLVSFDPRRARYVGLVAFSSTNGSVCTAVSELNILGY